MGLDYAVIVAYLLGMIGMGWWGMRRATTKSEYLVAGRRLGGVMYSGTMSAIVLGGASTIGGVRLGYQYGISGAWLVLAIGLGILLLSAAFARRIARLRVYTVSDMLDIRYGGSSAAVSGVVMWGYALMLTVTSLGASSTIFNVLFGFDRWASILLAGGIIVLYSVLGGMWSISMTDIVQFAVKTVGILLLLLPFALARAGGFAGMRERLSASDFDFTAIGGTTIVTLLVTYTLGLLIGQDIWQRVFTARTPKVATWGGITSGLYCVVYAFAGALIGMATHSLYPGIGQKDTAFATAVENFLPMGVRGLVLAAALAALMSTSSGALIASSTVAANDIWPRLSGRSGSKEDIHSNRLFTLVLGVIAILLAMLIEGVIAALTVAYNLLVGGLLVAIVGGMVWKRGNRQGALASMASGAVTVVVVMFTNGLEANEVIFYGLGVSLVFYVVVSLLTPPTDAAVREAWTERISEKVPA
ncbi:sodium:solute symporter [Actinocrispum sp. NPDC049592]|uniref:sodium:solute symporter n=1 Tax=Actinocrispum sp. NPDC049592 TaxID=3154835 RepID=UPI00341DCC64